MIQTTVYLIDDEPDLLELLAEAVELTGLKARSFTQANHFFNEVTQFEPGSILVLDLQMPEMDGIEVMRQLAKMADPPALILISGHDTGILHAAERLGRAHNLEILASLNKPVSLDRFQQLLNQHSSSSEKPPPRAHQSVKHKLTTDELLSAFAQRQLINYYQPQLDIKTGALVGVEVLVRWQHPERGLLGPNLFLPLVESAGLMGVLTVAVLEQALQQCGDWLMTGLDIQISVNMSASTITNLALPEQIVSMVGRHAVQPSRITMEVTESTLMQELTKSLDILTRLRLKGIKLSIDDFGTGYSSMLQLHRVPFCELKIDQSFVGRMDSDKEACAIVETIIMLSHKLGMKSVAEGVEAQAHWDHLAALGCDWAQGYLMARPMPGDKILEWEKNRG